MSPATATRAVGTTAVRMDQPLEQLLRPAFGELLLPLGEEYRSSVLFAWAVLWEQAGPAFRIGVDLVAVARSKLAANAITRNDCLHGEFAFANDAWIGDIQCDPEPVDLPSVLGYGPVAEVQPEKMHVVGPEAIEVVPVSAAALAGIRPDGVSGGTAWAVGAGEPACVPISDCRQWQAKLSRHSTCS